MGVKDLSWIIRNNKDRYSVRHKLRNTRLVIDGSNFLRSFWKGSSIPFKCGGDYEMYATKCKDFLRMLERCNISPYVVFNGAHSHEESKIKKEFERRQERVDCMEGILKVKDMDAYNMLPILARETFCQVLVEMGVPHVTCEEDSAKDIAVLANKWKCPVYSNTSDFFVYPLEGGFINFDEAWNAPFIITVQQENPYIQVTLYRYELFETRGAAPDTFILPYYAVLLGNGHLNPDYLAKMYECIKLPTEKRKRKLLTERLLDWLLSNRNTIEDSITNITKRLARQAKILEAIRRAISEYVDVDAFPALNLQAFFETAYKHGALYCMSDAQDYQLSDFESSHVTDTLPDWFLVSCRHSLISRNLQNAVLRGRVMFDCQAEDFNRPSSYESSKGLRKILYGILHGNEGERIREIDRVGKLVKENEVQPSNGIPGCMLLPTIQTMKSFTKAETVILLLKSLQINDDIISDESPVFTKIFAGLVSLLFRGSIRPIRNGNRFAIIWGTLLLQAKYMAEHGQEVDKGVDEDHVPEEVRTAYLRSSEQQLDDLLRRAMPFFEEPSYPSVYIIHGFSMYQACLVDARHLNEVLMSPILLPSPRLMFHGSLFYNLCARLESDRDPQGLAEDLFVAGSPLMTLGMEMSRMVDRVLDGRWG